MLLCIRDSIEGNYPHELDILGQKVVIEYDAVKHDRFDLTVNGAPFGSLPGPSANSNRNDGFSSYMSSVLDPQSARSKLKLVNLTTFKVLTCVECVQ